MTDWKSKLARTAQRNRQEIVKAKLDRREMLRLGLITAGGSLVLKSGLSSRAQAALTDVDPRLGAVPASPPTTPWVQPMPRLVLKNNVDPHDMLGGPPDGMTPIDGGTKRIPHQYCGPYNSLTGDCGPGPAGNFAPKKYYELVMQEAQHKFHPSYAPTTVWAFDGQFPGPLIKARYGQPIMVRFHNHLPSVKVPQSFGIAEMTTHLHNAHTPSESDGNPVNYFNSINDPGPIDPETGLPVTPPDKNGFKDQHYPNVLAGFTDPKFGATATSFGQGDPTEALSSLWYHDHHLDYTAQNVYKGMFGCYNLFDDKDCDDETSGLHLPSGAYDIPLFVNDAVFDHNCQAVFDLFDLDGILGDKICVNGAIQPYLNVDRRRYRFRLYNPGPSRWYEFSLWDGTNFIPFWQISSDGNLLPQAVSVPSVRIAVAERADIMIDFSKLPSTTRRLYLVNRLEQVNGRGPTGRVLSPGTPLMQINLGGVPAHRDDSVDIDALAAAKQPFLMRALPDADFSALLVKASKAPLRTWRFERGNGAWQVNGQLFDENVVSASIPLGSEEVWSIQNPGGDWRHPVHIHFEEHRTLSRNGVQVKPNTQFNACIDYARKDVIELNTNEDVRLFMRFRDMKGRYVMHCHNVVHEDHAMMVRWDIV
ncbi:MAG TPA: multicopper oxidase domain-containing protein [Tepidisphaeraceae bacterium]|nr:multicopper oxidase domain-containing protein [Tepidisphaeraceae bacterium]